MHSSKRVPSSDEWVEVTDDVTFGIWAFKVSKVARHTCLCLKIGYAVLLIDARAIKQYLM